jgi:hypothetical protein
MKSFGMVILILGVILTLYSTVTYFTREKIVDVGSVEITKNKKHTVNWSPYLGVALIAVGGVVLYRAAKS